MADLHLERDRHARYWQRCLKTLLPTQYTSTDSNRMLLGFFILSALDLLGDSLDTLPEPERANIREWILKCQHPNGGFCGSPNHRYPDEYYVDGGHGKPLMDPANLPATYFAILSLSYVGSFDKIRKQDCMRWLKTLQREDGSFGELVTEDGTLEGGRDMRYCYVAAAIRWILSGDQEELEDIDVERLVDHLRNGQTYDGGISESSKHEAHAGYTYCAIAALAFLNRLPGSLSLSPTSPKEFAKPVSYIPALTNLAATIRWLVSRQVEYQPEEQDEENAMERPPLPLQQQRDALVGNFETSSGPVSFAELSLRESECVGFNGRCNKGVDTCYTFWVAASLDIIGQNPLINTEASRRFLFEKTQHQIGGFGKRPGSPPDIYHSYLGLAALAIMKDPGLKSFDSALCVSMQQRERIGRLRKDAFVPTKTYWRHGYRFAARDDDPDFEKIMASSEDPPTFMAHVLKTPNTAPSIPK